MKTKKKFFLKGAGISLAKAAGISLAFVLAFAMAFAACDNDGSSGSKGGTIVPDGPTDMGDGPTAADWTAVKGFLEASGVGDVIYIRDLAEVTVGETHIPYGKTLVITGEVEGVAPSSSVSTLPDVPRLIIPNRAKLVVDAGGTLVLGGPKAETYAGIVDIKGGGALWVEEGAILSINMSSRVSVNGENPDRPDYSDDYIALNLESRSILAVLGTFVDGDDIIAKSSAERRLIDILTSTAPVAVGAVKVYNSIPKAGVAIEESSTLKGALNDGKNKATVDSPIKVADSPDDVTTLLEGVVTRASAKWFTQRIIYSGSGALGDSGKKLNIPLNTRIIVESKVTQNKDVTIQKHPSNGTITGTYGILEIAPDASITVTKGLDSSPSTLKLSPSTSGETTGLKVDSEGTLAVAAGGILDLSDAQITTNKNVILNGEIKAEKGGIIALPGTSATAYSGLIDWGTEDTGIGKITLVANSVAGYGVLDTAYPYYPAIAKRNIGPLQTTPAERFDYSWEADDTASVVTLSGSTLTLTDGKLSVTSPTGTTGKTLATNEAVLVKKGTLTVASTLTIATANTGMTLTVGTDGSVVVASGGFLDLSTLTVAANKNVVTLNGNGKIEVANGGTIKLPAFGTDSGVDQDTWPQINFADGGSIRLNFGSTATTANAAPRNKYVGPYGTAPQTTDADDVWEWSGTNTTTDKSYVDLKAGGGFTISGNLTAAKSETINTPLTVSSGAVLTVAPDVTLALGADGKLDVRGKIVLEAVDQGSNGGALGMTALKPLVGTQPAVTIYGAIEVENSATLTYPASTNKNWAYVGNGKAKVYKGGLVLFGADEIVSGTSPLFAFDNAGSNATSYVEFGVNGVNIGDDATQSRQTKITLNKNTTIPVSNTWYIEKDANLTIATACTDFTVDGTLNVMNGGTLGFTGTASKLWLTENTPTVGSGRLILGDGSARSKTVISVITNPNFTTSSGHVNKASIAGATSNNEVLINIFGIPGDAIGGWSTAATNDQEAFIVIGQAVAALGTAIAFVGPVDGAVKPVAAVATNPVPAAGGFGEGVTIATAAGVTTVSVSYTGATVTQ